MLVIISWLFVNATLHVSHQHQASVISLKSNKFFFLSLNNSMERIDRLKRRRKHALTHFFRSLNSNIVKNNNLSFSDLTRFTTNIHILFSVSFCRFRKKKQRPHIHQILGTFDHQIHHIISDYVHC